MDQRPPHETQNAETEENIGTTLQTIGARKNFLN